MRVEKLQPGTQQDTELERLLPACNDALARVSGRAFPLLMVSTFVAIVIFSLDDEKLVRAGAVTLPLFQVEVSRDSFFLGGAIALCVLYIPLLSALAQCAFCLRRFQQVLRRLPDYQSLQLRLRLMVSPVSVISNGGFPSGRRVLEYFSWAQLAVMLAVPLGVLWLLFFKSLYFGSDFFIGGVALIYGLAACSLLAFFGVLFVSLRRPRVGSLRRGRPVSRTGYTPVGAAIFSVMVISIGAPLLFRPSLGLRDLQLCNGQCPDHVTLGLRDDIQRISRLPIIDATAAPPSSGSDDFQSGLGKVNPFHSDHPSYAGAHFHRVLWPSSRIEKAIMDDATITECHFLHSRLAGASLQRAKFEKVSFRAATLINANLSQSTLNKVDLSRSDLSGARFGCTRLNDVTFEDALLNGVHFQGEVNADCGLGFQDGGSVVAARAHFAGALLWAADFSGTDFSGSTLATRTTFDRACGAGARFNHSRADTLSFRDARLLNADFADARIAGADFSGAQLVVSDLSGAKGRGASFENSDLSGGLGRDGDFRFASFSGATMRKTDLAKADLRGAFLDAFLVADRPTHLGLSGTDAEHKTCDYERLSSEESQKFAGVEGKRADQKRKALNEVRRSLNFGGADLRGASLRKGAWIDADFIEQDGRPATVGLVDFRVEERDQEEATKRLKSLFAKGSIQVEAGQPCLFNVEVAGCFGEGRIDEFDEALAEFLSAQAGTDEYMLCALWNRLDQHRREPEVLRSRLVRKLEDYFFLLPSKPACLSAPGRRVL